MFSERRWSGGGFSFSVLLKSVLRDLKHEKQPSPPIPPQCPETLSQNNKKSAENQIHAVHSEFLKVTLVVSIQYVNKYFCKMLFVY